ncbi:protein kinase domain-containing protein [Gordonia humi]|uniref:non-specific serine/threonine protein kinase n=1 Tax=Gordonia humi TaxID=686429 RepID=A0A840EZE9_9ACTN|nr:protein kinase [Gordonia humi]MBB4135613.1 serine/threonine protein kinase [Gordonia humi]
MSLNWTGMAVGTMLYFSPESIEGRDFDIRADIYSLGCTAFELLTGSAPFAGNSITALMSAHLTQPPPPAGRIAPHLPPTVDSVFARVLAKNPTHRFSSATEFVDALEGAVAGRVTVPPTPPPAPRVPPPAWACFPTGCHAELRQPSYRPDRCLDCGRDRTRRGDRRVRIDAQKTLNLQRLRTHRRCPQPPPKAAAS